MRPDIVNRPVSIVLLLAFAVSTCLYYACSLFFLSTSFSFVDIVLFPAALSLALVGINDMGSKGVRTSNVFLAAFFGCLAISCIRLSNLQESKNLTDFYYYFFGPCVFAAVLWIFDSKKLDGVQMVRRVVKPDMVVAAMLVAYVFLHVYIVAKTGYVRFFSSEAAADRVESSVLPGVSGLAGVIMWMLFIFLPSTRNRFVRALVITALIITCVFVAKRGTVVRLLIASAMLYLLRFDEFRLTKEMVAKVIALGIAFIMLFGLWGNVRQIERGASDASYVTELLDSKADSSIINWAYAYTGFNFEVLKVDYIEGEYSGKPEEFLSPLMRVVRGSEYYADYVQRRGTVGINGFNAASFLAPFIRGTGPFYFFELALIAGQVLLLSYWSRETHSAGAYAVLLMMSALTPFGNMYSFVQLLYALIASLVILSLLNIWHLRNLTS